jgi:hypothetical protein
MYQAKQAMLICKNARRTLKIMGAPGCGKTQGTEQYHADLEETLNEDVFFQEFNAARANLGQVSGFLIPVKDAKANIMRGEFTYPTPFIDRRTGKYAHEFRHGVILIEEWGQGTPEVRRALATLIQEYRIGNYALPEGFQVILLTNRSQDRSGVSGREFMFLVNRWVEVTLETTLQDWVHWAETYGNVSELAMTFAIQNPESVFGVKMPDDDVPYMTLRSLVTGDAILNEAIKAKIDLKDPMLTEMLMGTMGKGGTAQLIAFARLRSELATYEEIVSRPKTAKVPADGRADALMLTTHMLARFVDKDNIAALLTYMERLPDAFGITFVKSALKRFPALINTKEMGAYCRKNPAIIAAVHR